MGNSKEFQKLSPESNVDLFIYKEALDFAFGSDDIRNIGITGPYGSGKSSVIESYKYMHKEKNYMHISLANFDKEKSSDKYSDDIEGKIINQLIHQIKKKQISQTKFSIKGKMGNYLLIKHSILIILFIVSILYNAMFSGWENFVSSASQELGLAITDILISPITRIVLGIATAIIGAYYIYILLRAQTNLNLFRGIKVKGNSVEIFDKEDDLVFDKYLDEILFLIEKSNIDIVIFEDLDRYDNYLIFQKLKEINVLFNNSPETSKVLKFVYLIRDDMFTSKDRTKFFDFIIPIVPVVDSTNSLDQLISIFNSLEESEQPQAGFLQEISLYVDDMRILKNIYNEYVIYKGRIGKLEQDLNKLLAIIIYKNVFPKDFIDLQSGKGFVFNLFDKKGQFIEKEVEKKKEEKKLLEKLLEDSTKEHLESEEEINELYKSKINNSYGVQRDHYISKREERITNIKNRDEVARNQILKQITNIESIINSLEERKLSEIITRDNADDIFKLEVVNEVGEKTNFIEIKGNEYFPLIKYLIRYGYIDETYPDYMTHFYENSISRNDKIFVRHVIDDIASKYERSLDSPETVYSRLGLRYYSSDAILNYDLLNYLYELGNDEGELRIKHIVEVIRETKKEDFIYGYFLNPKYYSQFVISFNDYWPEMAAFIINECNWNIETIVKYVTASMRFMQDDILIKMNEGDILKSFIEEGDVLKYVVDKEAIYLKRAINTLSIKFNNIYHKNYNPQITEMVYEENAYKLSFENINYILSRWHGYIYQESLKHSQYSKIFSLKDTPLYKYVHDNIGTYFEMYLKKCEGKITDSEEAAIAVLNNNDITDEVKHKYIKALKSKVNNIDDIMNNAIWNELLQNDCISYTAKNVIKFYLYKEKEIGDDLVNFINRNNGTLDLSYKQIVDCFGKEDAANFVNDILRCSGVDITSYRNIFKTLNTHYSAFQREGLSDDHIDVLIEESVIRMNKDTLSFFRNKYPQKAVKFIECNKKEYLNDVLSEETFDYAEMISLLTLGWDDDDYVKAIKMTTQTISLKEPLSENMQAYVIENNFDDSELEYALGLYNTESQNLRSIIEVLASKKVKSIIDNNIVLDKELVCEVLINSDLFNDEKKALLVTHANLFDFDEIVDIFECMGERAFIGVLTLGENPKISKTEENKNLLIYFKKRKWISSYVDGSIRGVPDYYIAYSKRKKNKQR